LNTSKDEITVRYPEIGLDKHDLKNLFVALISLQEAMKDIVINEIPDLDESHIFWSLNDASTGSSNYDLVPNLPKLMVGPNMLFGAISENDYSKIPISSSEHLRDFHKYNRKLKSNPEFFIAGNHITTMYYDSVVEVPEHKITKYETIEFGELVRVGGVDPTARVKFLTGETISCSIAKKKAKEIGTCLYENLSFEGICTRNNTTNKIIDFKIKDFTLHKKAKLTDTFKRLREAGGAVWDDIDNLQDILADG